MNPKDKRTASLIAQMEGMKMLMKAMKLDQPSEFEIKLDHICQNLRKDESWKTH